MWPLAEVSVAAADEFRLWEGSEFGDINLLASLNDYDPERIRVWEQERAAVINFGFLSEANTYAYREPKVSLASVLDHRFGEMRDQETAEIGLRSAMTGHLVLSTLHTNDAPSSLSRLVDMGVDSFKTDAPRSVWAVGLHMSAGAYVRLSSIGPHPQAGWGRAESRI